MSYLAIVDLGSNSARMVVERLNNDGTYTEIIREKEDTRIAQNMGPERVLKEVPIARTIAALKYFQSQYSDFEPTVRAITTAAVRVARNQTQFLTRVKNETGIDFEVLTGDKEAYYDYLGVITTLAIDNGIILDTGGASVELIAVIDGQNQSAISLPFGAVTLSETFNLANEVSQRDIAAACKDILSQYEVLPWLNAHRGLPVILLGGGNRSLARMGRTILGKDIINQIHGFEMSVEMVEHIFQNLRYMSRQEREHIAGLEISRADIIISGLLPLLNLMQLIDAPRVIFSESGVREGLIAEMMKNNDKKIL